MNANTTAQIIESVRIRTNWTYAQTEMTVTQLLSNLGEKTALEAKHEGELSHDVVMTALEIWDRTAE